MKEGLLSAREQTLSFEDASRWREYREKKIQLMRNENLSCLCLKKIVFKKYSTKKKSTVVKCDRYPRGLNIFLVTLKGQRGGFLWHKRSNGIIQQ